MATNDSTNEHGPSGEVPAAAAPPAGGVPPLLPPPLPLPGKRRKSRALPLVITLVCVAGFAVLLTGGVLLWAATAAARETRSERRVIPSASETRSEPRVTTTVRETRSEPPARPIANETRSEPGVTSSARVIKAEPGLSYTNVKMSVGNDPVSLHVLKIDRLQKDLTFFSAHAGTKVLGVSFLADQARGVPREFGRAIGGVNGDFYDRDNPTYAGDPRGIQIINGEITSAPDTVCVWFDANDNPHLDEVKGDFNVTWPSGRKTPFGLNQRRRTGMTVLYTPTYGPSTRVTGGRELILEKDGDGPWLPLQAGQNYRARVREVSTGGNTRLAPDVMVLSFAPDQLAGVPAVMPGDLLQLSTATTPDLKDVKMAIAGGPAIIKDGKPFSLKRPPPGTSGSYAEASKYQQHPRSAVGWSPTHVYLITVDGRQPGLSLGMRLAELAEFMAGLGCTEAMNLDGGKSAQMWMNGRIMNSPCQGVDTVANSLMVVRKPDER